MLTEEEYAAIIKSFNVARSLDDLMTCLRWIIKAYGLRNIAYLANSIPGPHGCGRVMLTTYDPAWMAIYEERRYLGIDPVVRFGRDILVPLDWKDLGRMDEKWRALLNEAQDYGVGRQGMTFPLRGGAIFTVTADATARDWHLLRYVYMRELPTLAMHIHEKVLKLSFASPFAPRELQCVQGLALGRATKVIADELGISESAVRKSVGTATEKLGCQNATHLVAAAVACGLVTVD